MIGDRSQACNTRLVGTHDLQGRAALQVTVRGQWCYVGHLPGHHDNPLNGEHEDNGTSILDISDPAGPVLVAHIPGSSPRGNCRAVQMVTNPHDGRDYLIRNNEAAPEFCFEVFDISDRAASAPRLANDGHAAWPAHLRPQGVVGRRQWPLLRCAPVRSGSAGVGTS